MLMRHEIGTRGHILLWLAGKDPDVQFDWKPAAECARGQYANDAIGQDFDSLPPAVIELDEIAKRLAWDGKTLRRVSFGELHTAVAVAWS